MILLPALLVNAPLWVNAAALQDIFRYLEDTSPQFHSQYSTWKY